MGDILHALPAVTALRQTHPSWQIDWVIEPRWKGLLAASTAALDGPRCAAKPLADHIHLAPTKAWGAQPMSLETARGIVKLRRELQAVEYDAVLDLQGSIRSAVIARLAGCGRVIGDAHPREAPAAWLFTDRVTPLSDHMIEQAVELASALAGDELGLTAPDLPVDEAAERWCDARLSGGPNGPLVLMNPGAGWGAKRWPVERYADVARALGARGFRVLVNAGPGEEVLAEEVVRGAVAGRYGTEYGPERRPESSSESSSQSPSEFSCEYSPVYSPECNSESGKESTRPQSSIPLNHAPCSAVFCTIDQLIALTRRVDLVIAGDTGPLHLACALGRPVVGIFGPTDPRRNGPFGTRSVVLRSPLSQRDHRRHAAPEAGLLTITAQTVVEAAAGLLPELFKAQQ